MQPRTPRILINGWARASASGVSAPSAKAVALAALVLLLATVATVAGGPTSGPAIVDGETLERDLAALARQPDARERQREKTDLPPAGPVALAGAVQVADSLALERLRHWGEGGRVYGLKVAGRGLVRLELPLQDAGDGPVVGDPRGEVRFYSIAVRPALSADPAEPTLLSVAGAVFAFSVEPPTMGIRAGRFFVLNGGAARARQSDWVSGRVSFPVTEGFEAAFPLEFVVRIDRELGEWDLFFRGRLHYAGMLHDRGGSGLWYRSGGAGVSEFAELAASAANPLFDDADRDGIDDAVERDLGFSSEVNDRHVRDPLGAFTNLEHFINRRTHYASRLQVDLEATLVEAIAARRQGRGLGPLEELAIPESERARRFSREEWEAAREAARSRSRRLAEPAARRSEEAEAGVP